MLKFSTFTGAHNNRETEGRKEIDGAISAQPDSAVVGEQLIARSERRRAEKRRVSRGDTELHNTDFKGERMSVKKDTKLHVEKDTKIHEHTCQISIIVKCKYNFSMLQLIFSMSSQP